MCLHEALYSTWVRWGHQWHLMALQTPSEALQVLYGSGTHQSCDCCGSLQRSDLHRALGQLMQTRP